MEGSPQRGRRVIVLGGYATQLRTDEPEIIWTKTASDRVDGIILDNLKTWLNRPLEDAFWDAETASLILIALRAIESWCHISIAPSTWVATMPYILPQQRIVRRPFLSVESITYADPETGTITTVDPATYQVGKARQMCGQVRIGNDAGDWPDAAERQDAFTMTVKTGWPLDESSKPIIPPDLIHGIMMTVAHLDTNRGDTNPSGGHLANTVYGATHSSAAPIIPALAQALLAPFRYQALYIG